MTRLILDTTVLIAAERSDLLITDVISDEDDTAIAAVTAAELLVGIELADDAHRAARQDFVDDILATILVESYDLDVARAHARFSRTCAAPVVRAAPTTCSSRRPQPPAIG